MTVDAFDSTRADHIYRVGPETLVAQSHAVATGPVSRYAKQSVEMSQPGPDGFPLRWVIAGRVEQPQVIKGQPPSVELLHFVRHEQSGQLPPAQPTPAWEQALGELMPGDEVLLFFQGDPARPTLRVLPSRDPATGLAATVRRAAAIQALPTTAAREAAWFDHLQAAPDDEGRQAALRSLLALGSQDWARMQSALVSLLARPGLSASFRSYAAGIIAFSLMQGRWAGQEAAPVDFVCQQFDSAVITSTSERWLAMQGVLTLKQLMAFGASEPQSAGKRLIRQRVAQSVRQAEAAPGLAPEVEGQLRQIRASHAADF